MDRVEDLRALTFADGEVGTALCLDTLEHCADPLTACRELQRVVADGGVCVISSVWLIGVHAHPNDYWRFTPEGFRLLLEGFDDVHVAGWGDPDIPYFVFGAGANGRRAGRGTGRPALAGRGPGELAPRRGPGARGPVPLSAARPGQAAGHASCRAPSASARGPAWAPSASASPAAAVQRGSSLSTHSCRSRPSAGSPRPGCPPPRRAPGPRRPPPRSPPRRRRAPIVRPGQDRGARSEDRAVTHPRVAREGHRLVEDRRAHVAGTRGTSRRSARCGRSARPARSSIVPTQENHTSRPTRVPSPIRSRGSWRRPRNSSTSEKLARSKISTPAPISIRWGESTDAGGTMMLPAPKAPKR